MQTAIEAIAEAAGPASPRPARPNAFEFSASVPIERRKDVQALLDFHTRQPVLQQRIRACVEEFGAPEIIERGAHIQVGIARHGARCLFACHGERSPGAPVGVAVYLRETIELLRILHLAVHPAYEPDGRHARLNLAMALLNEMRQLALRFSGVRQVQLPYVPGGFLSVPRQAE